MSVLSSTTVLGPVRLTVAEWGSDPYSVELILLHRTAAPPGPAGRWLIDALTARRP